MGKPKTILIDAGHGGTDAGAVNGSRCEKDDNLKVAMAVKQLLEARGQNVIMPRIDDTYPSLASRTGMANGAGCDLLVSLHRNSFTSPTANGVEIWIYTTAGTAEEAVAATVLEHIAAVGVQSNRGVKRGNFHVLRESHMPAILVELGFISNLQDNQLFDRNLNAYATAVADGICEALGVEWRKQVQPSIRYRIQVGAFAERSNAERFLETVRDMGLDAFLVCKEAEYD